VQNHRFFASAKDTANILQQSCVNPLVKHDSSAGINSLLTGCQFGLVVNSGAAIFLDFRVTFKAVENLKSC
jgi:hypothetical protein